MKHPLWKRIPPGFPVWIDAHELGRPLDLHFLTTRGPESPWQRQQRKWERRWGAPSPAHIRDSILAVLEAYGVLDPLAEKALMLADIGRLDDVGMAVLTGAIQVDSGSRFLLDLSVRCNDVADFASLLAPFVAATGGEWQPQGLRSAGSRSSLGGTVTIDFETAGKHHHWELPQDWTDGLTDDCLVPRHATFGR